MQYVYAINSSFTVTSLLDLPMLRDILEACNLKPNYSLLGRELGYDRRTIKSHYENGMPDSHRHKPSMIDEFYDIIKLIGKKILNSYYMMVHTIQEVEEQVQKIILRSNLAVSQATRQIPSVLLAKEKESLTPTSNKSDKRFLPHRLPKS